IIRIFMFKYSTRPGIGIDLHHGGLANFINIRRNFLDMFFLSTKYSIISFVVYIIYAVLSFKLYTYRKFIGKKFVSLWIVMGLYLIIGFISALIRETRLFFPLSAMVMGLYFSQDMIKISFNENKFDIPKRPLIRR
ncbi:hypothetical protein, partial [Komagataeibacter sp. FXV3]|uniref:hypothetical protein n=1 Tax=Komagataeibacter sp. FXV3 TaxID=2608998 RepID=UPI001D0FFC49